MGNQYNYGGGHVEYNNSGNGNQVIDNHSITGDNNTLIDNSVTNVGNSVSIKVLEKRRDEIVNNVDELIKKLKEDKTSSETEKVMMGTFFSDIKEKLKGKVDGIKKNVVNECKEKVSSIMTLFTGFSTFAKPLLDGLIGKLTSFASLLA